MEEQLEEDTGAHVLLEENSNVVGGEDQPDPTVKLQMINSWPYIYGVKVPPTKSTKKPYKNCKNSLIKGVYCCNHKPGTE